MPQTILKPQIDLTFTDITAEALHHVDQSRLGTPEEVIRAALMSYRLLVVNHVRMEISNSTRMNSRKVLELIDTAGALYLKRFNTMVGPVAAASYLRAYQAAGAGDVPMSTIYALAEQHTARMGVYFNETSSEAMIQGFNTYVNQRVPARVAAERSLEAFGLTSRQMSGYTSIRVAGKISSAQELSVRGKILSYINKSLHDRLDIFATQEAHNLDQQAQQTAWMWLQNKGAISEVAEKVWLTARDERVCPECGPMHGKRVPVTARFKMPSGGLLYVPGAHPRCRCETRLVDPMQLVQKDLFGRELFEFNDEHPRDNAGRFSAKARAAATIRDRAKRAPTRFVETAEGDRPSAGFEQIVAAAERLRETHPVIEPALPRTPTLAPDRQQTLLPQQKLARQQSLVPEKQSLMTEQQSLSSSLKRQSLFASYQRLETSSQRLASGLMQDLIADVRRPTEKPKKWQSPTLRIVDREGRPMPVYAVADREMFDQHGRISLDDGLSFTPDINEVEQRSIDELASKMKGMRTSIAESGDAYQWKNGSTAYFEMSEIDDFVETLANAAGGEDNHWESITMHVTVTDEDGYESPARLSYGDMAEYWEVSPDDLRVDIVRMTDGYRALEPGEKGITQGRTYLKNPHSRTAHEDWRTSGEYNVYVASNEPIGNSKFQLWDIEPDVEMQSYE